MPLKLEIQLVPRPLFGVNLRKMLSRRAWSAFREEQLKDHPGHCDVCGVVTEKLHLHEEWEYDTSRALGRARLKGLQSVCFYCHGCEHYGWLRNFARNEATKEDVLELAAAHFCRVNSVDHSVFDQHVEHADHEWARRSKMMWQVDWGDYQDMLPKARLKEFHDKRGNPVPLLPIEPIGDEEEARLRNFIRNLEKLSRFYGVWIGQSNAGSMLPLHLRERGEEAGPYRLKITMSLLDEPNDLPMRLGDAVVNEFGVSLAWSDDPKRTKLLPPKWTADNVVKHDHPFVVKYF